jgi:HK97 family phage prohead protease
MEADFSGYATKAGIKCSDGRTILPGAFKHQDQMQVPLVWQHGHDNVENVLGHVILENRDDGVYTYGFFNSSSKAKHAHGLLEHGDIKHMSIWANQLVERGAKVLHGMIREVSLVLAGANPGALIQNVTIRHSDGEEVLDDEAIIYNDAEIEHEQPQSDDDVSHDETKKDVAAETNDNTGGNADKKELEELVHAVSDDTTVEDIYESLTDEQKDVVHYMLGLALESGQGANNLQQDNLGDAEDKDKDKDNTMAHNVFEKDKEDKATSLRSGSGSVLSHSDMEAIFSDAKKSTLKEAVESYALSHGIDDIDTLFPDARNLTGTPEWNKRRTEWVDVVLNGVRKSPFSRVKTLYADLTADEARAKGYITGSLKKEEYFSVSKRVTTPTTIYKKQKLDRDDMLDITDFDVVVWLKGEMRLMLEEELARAILISDGRDVSNEDKINEGNIRPISKDHQLYTTTITVNLSDASSDIGEFVDALITNRRFYKGTGLPTMFTTETVIAQIMTLKDGMGRRMYRTLDEFASEVRVAGIVPVEPMEDEPSIVAILVNLNDYNVGADRGGNVSLFDDFDIDYNQYKYLIETRVSGALVKLKSAIVVKKAASGTDTVVVPQEPTFVAATGVVTIPSVTGVVYKNGETGATLSSGAQAAIPVGDSLVVVAEAAAGRFLEQNADTMWTFWRR